MAHQNRRAFYMNLNTIKLLWMRTIWPMLRMFLTFGWLATYSMAIFCLLLAFSFHSPDSSGTHATAQQRRMHTQRDRLTQRVSFAEKDEDERRTRAFCCIQFTVSKLLVHILWSSACSWFSYWTKRYHSFGDLFYFVNLPQIVWCLFGLLFSGKVWISEYKKYIREK